ncbi:unnamed protein product [Rotaria sordida]|uniref:LNS2/PITP domain-containing protein n=3 Tax=Rotaria sordida TaxID=392033 RepID=A0A815GRF4_9BILA|nr:unnamed protein product [Rotaria sordida]CAF1598198.1 unnamed protein product [Rotaria sordida]
MEQILSNLNDLVFDSTEEFLATVVNQPLKVIHDQTVGKDYLLCDRNRNGDSYRSPWTNTYTPPSNGNLPSDRLRQLEIKANQMFEQYHKMLFKGGVSSVYFWDLENGFAGVILIKKFDDGNSTSEECQDSIHVVVVEEKQNGHSAHYKLTSTVMFWLQTNKTMFDMMNLAGKLIQLESDHRITDFSQHINNIGEIVKQMENKIHQILNSNYSEKEKNIFNSLYNSENIQDCVRLQQANFTDILFQQSTSLSPSKTKHLKQINSPQNYLLSLIKSKSPACIETDYIEESSKDTNKSNYLNDILMRGKNMNDVDFENFIQNQATNFYWETLTERTRIKLVDQLRENQQLCELIDELKKEHSELEEKIQPYINLINDFENNNEMNSLLPRTLTVPIESKPIINDPLPTAEESNSIVNSIFSQSAPIINDDNTLPIRMAQSTESTSFYLNEDFLPTSTFEKYLWPSFSSSKQSISKEGMYLDDITNNNCDDCSRYLPQMNYYLNQSRTPNDDDQELGTGNSIPNSPVREYETSYHNWNVASALIASASVYHKQLPLEISNTKNETTSSTSVQALVLVVKSEVVPTMLQNQNSIRKNSNDSEQEDHEVRNLTDKMENQQTTSTKKKKPMILTSDQLKRLNLKTGINHIEFSVTTALQGTTMSHDSIAEFFQAIQENGYQFIYLSARAIGQSKITRNFLRNIKQCGFALSIGPLLILPDTLVIALYREVIARTPEDFKIECLKNIASLFPNKNLFYAGFGNRLNDQWTYTTVGISETCIFTINPRGEIIRQKLSQVLCTSYVYKNLHEVVDQVFPPMDSFSASEPYSSFTFWRKQLIIDSLEDEMREHLEEILIRQKSKGKGSTTQISSLPKATPTTTLTKRADEKVIVEGETTTADNNSILSSKKRITHSISQTTTSIKHKLSKKERKRLEKVLDIKKKKAKRVELLDKLGQIQISNDELALLHSVKNIDSKIKHQPIDTQISITNSSTSINFNQRSRKRSAQVSTEIIQNDSESNSNDDDDDETINDEEIPLPHANVQVERSEEIQAIHSQLPIITEEQTFMEAIHDNLVVLICGETEPLSIVKISSIYQSKKHSSSSSSYRSSSERDEKHSSSRHKHRHDGKSLKKHSKKSSKTRRTSRSRSPIRHHSSKADKECKSLQTSMNQTTSVVATTPKPLNKEAEQKRLEEEMQKRKNRIKQWRTERRIMFGIDKVRQESVVQVTKV